MIKLYCHSCNATHDFAPSQMERIIYCLQGELADAITTDKDDTLESYDATFCLQTHLEMSFDPEGYAEWTASALESRQSMQKRSAKP